MLSSSSTHTHIHGNLDGTNAAVAASTSARLKLRETNRPHSISTGNLHNTVPFILSVPTSVSTPFVSIENSPTNPPVRSYSPDTTRNSPVHEIILPDRQRAKSRIRDSSSNSSSHQGNIGPTFGKSTTTTSTSSTTMSPNSSKNVPPLRPGTIGTDIMNDYNRRLKESEVATHTLETGRTVEGNISASFSSSIPVLSSSSSSSSSSSTYRRGSFSSAVAAVGINVQPSLGLSSTVKLSNNSHTLLPTSSSSSRIILKPRSGTLLSSTNKDDPVSEAIRAAVSATSSAALITNRVMNHTWNTHSTLHTQIHAPMGGRFDEANLSPTPRAEISRKNIMTSTGILDEAVNPNITSTVVAINIEQQPDPELLSSSTRTVMGDTIPIGTMYTIDNNTNNGTNSISENKLEKTTTDSPVEDTATLTSSSSPIASPPIASRFHPALTPSLVGSTNSMMDMSSRRSKSVTMLNRRSTKTGSEGLNAAIQASAAVQAKLHSNHSSHSLSSYSRNLQPTIAAVRQSAELSASIAANIASHSGIPPTTVNHGGERSESPSSITKITIINTNGTNTLSESAKEASTSIPSLGNATYSTDNNNNGLIFSSVTKNGTDTTVPNDIATLTSLAAAHANDFDLQHANPPRVAPHAPKSNNARQDKPRVARANSRTSSPAPTVVNVNGVTQSNPKSSSSPTTSASVKDSGIPIQKTYAQRGNVPGNSHGGGHPSPSKADTVRVIIRSTEERLSPTVRSTPTISFPTTVGSITSVIGIPSQHTLAPVYNILSAPANRPSSPLRSPSPPRANPNVGRGNYSSTVSAFAPIPWNPNSNTTSTSTATTNNPNTTMMIGTHAPRSPSPTGHQVKYRMLSPSSTGQTDNTTVFLRRSPSPSVVVTPSSHRVLLKRAQSPQASVSAAINAGLSAANAAETAAALATAASITNQGILPMNGDVVSLPPVLSSQYPSTGKDRLSPVHNRVQIARDASAGGRGGVALSSSVPTFASMDNTYTSHLSDYRSRTTSSSSSPVQAYINAVTNTNPLTSFPSRTNKKSSPIISILNDDSQVNLTQVTVKGPSKLLVGGSPRTGQAAAAVVLSQPAPAPQVPLSATYHSSPSKEKNGRTLTSSILPQNSISPSRGSRQTDLSETMNTSSIVQPMTVSTSLADIAAGDIGVWMVEGEQNNNQRSSTQISIPTARYVGTVNTNNSNMNLFEQLNSIADKSTAFRRDVAHALGKNNNPIHQPVPVVHPRTTVSPPTVASMYSPTIVIPNQTARAMVQLDVDRGVTSTVLRPVSPVSARRQPSPEHASVVPHVQATQITHKNGPVTFTSNQSAKALGRIVRRPSVDVHRSNVLPNQPISSIHTNNRNSKNLTVPMASLPTTPAVTGQLILVSSPVPTIQQPNNRAGAVGKVLGGRKAHGATDTMNGVIDKVSNHPFVSSIAELTNASLNALRRF